MNRSRQIALGLAAIGAGYCTYLLVGFVQIIRHNRLPWDGYALTREHYLAVGEAYSRGFAVGFFLCFCLTVVALIVGTWYEESVKSRRAGAGAPAAPPTPV